MEIIQYRPIGVVHTGFKEPKGTPIQFAGSKNAPGEIVIFPEFAEGLEDLEEFSHLILLTHLHLTKNRSLKVIPFMDDIEHGIFATRSPARPNPIGFSIVRLKKIENNRLFIEDVDIVDGTPLLDIKPYVPEFDRHTDIRIGWLEQVRGAVWTKQSDDRFKS